MTTTVNKRQNLSLLDRVLVSLGMGHHKRGDVKNSPLKMNKTKEQATIYNTYKYYIPLYLPERSEGRYKKQRSTVNTILDNNYTFSNKITETQNHRRNVYRSIGINNETSQVPSASSYRSLEFQGQLPCGCSGGTG